jgi:hypothetical protein
MGKKYTLEELLEIEEDALREEYSLLLSEYELLQKKYELLAKLYKKNTYELIKYQQMKIEEITGEHNSQIFEIIEQQN